MRTVYPAQQENIESQDYIEEPKAFMAQAELAKQIEYDHGHSGAQPVLRRQQRARRQRRVENDGPEGKTSARRIRQRHHLPASRRNMTVLGIQRLGGNTSSTSTPAWN